MDDAADAVHNLHRLSLAALDGHTGVMRVHALVQRATRDELPANDIHAAAHAAADALLETWSLPERNPAHSQMWQANGVALQENTGESLLLPDAHELLFRIGRSFGEAGQVSVAVAHFTDLHTRCLRILGPDHCDTLTAGASLAYWLRYAGDPAGAAAAFEVLLADHLRVLGPDHPNTLITRGELAWWRGEAGDAAGAAAATREVLADRLRVLGPDHPDTLAARHNLLTWRGILGDPAGAAADMDRLLADVVRIFGPDHDRTQISRADLAYWRGQAQADSNS